MLTPDSSRYWPVEGYQSGFAPGADPPSYDKQFVRVLLVAVLNKVTPCACNRPAPNTPTDELP